MRPARVLASCCTTLLVAAPAWCEQSVHAPAAAAARTIHELGIVLYLGAGVITIFVVALALRAMLGAPRAASERVFVLGGGVIFPVALLSILFVAALLVGNALSRPLPAPAARIQVIAHQWWWEVRYLPPPNPGSELAILLQQLCSAGRREARAPRRTDEAADAIVTANEIRIPVGHPVELELHTRDVIHSVWVPALGGKVDTIPGRVNRLVWQAERAGVFRGQCAEYCGGPHGLMGLMVIAEEEPQYRRWLERQAAPARRSAADTEAARGERAFLGARCSECHTVRGTSARGTEGPDLTHVGSRRTIAAATLDNHVGTLAGWIADPQGIKPGNRMPAERTLAGAQLRALAAYLAGLD